MRSGNVLPLLLTALLLVPAVGCKKKKGTTVIGSCDEPKKLNVLASYHSCRDLYDPIDLKRCPETRGVPSNKPCGRKGMVAGCKQTDWDTWFYDDDLSNTPQSIAAVCGREPTILPTGAGFVAKTDAQINADKTPVAIAQHGAKVKANLATIATIAKKLPTPTSKVDAAGLAGMKGDVVALHAEDLADLEHPKTLAHRVDDTTNVGVCSRIVNRRQTPTDDPDILYGCAERQVLAVISLRTYKDPVNAGQTNDGKVRTTFVTKGRVTGDVLLFRLDNGKYLGSYPFDVTNGPIADNTTFEKLRDELRSNYVGALSSGLKRSAPAFVPRF